MIFFIDTAHIQVIPATQERNGHKKNVYLVKENGKWIISEDPKYSKELKINSIIVKP